ncbi:AAA family ATPase [Helicobacter brantae]|uniref:ATPase dynein-related AAA domain-containing protein n=1 Tax=Helicobacter brantae TaxID=375927 RepID=A0A3D8J160_9HELI|nr:AAA family ATPase [Helicobacter brantae]RDU70946.1 hypothetical protein CQA58_03990 [Helicobacter brantae]
MLENKNHPENAKVENQNISKKSKNQRFWLYKAGENGDKWEEMYSKGLMGLGWRKLENLQKYSNKEEIDEALKSLYPSDSTRQTNNRKSNWDFCNEVQIGDIIIVGNGRNKFMGYGEVEGEYFYNPNLDDDFASFRKVKWFAKGEWICEDSGNWAIKALTDVTEDYALLYPILIQMGFCYQPLNQILYGSPATGKTYNTIDRALEILVRHDKDLRLPSKNNREARKQLFEEYKAKERIEFVTFHQSYGYEEFVEGIKPITDKNGDISYEVTNGIFKELCRKAQEPILTNQKLVKELEEAYNNFVSQLYVYPTSLLSPKYIDERPTKSSLEGLIGNGEKIGTSKSGTDKAKFYYLTDSSGTIRVLADTEKPSPIPLSCNEFIYSYCRGLKGTRFSYYSVFDEILNDFRLKREDIQKELAGQIQNTQPYILIIDEINRGNISKIFGELITLIEPSKRIGASEELKVKLPYSGTSDEPLFGVPSNLYIIGTMNTADRSITSLDTALRRRFEFVEMMPKPSELEGLEVQGTDIELGKMLEQINKRIEFLYDREKTIGHAFFLSECKEGESSITLEQLKGIFQNKIIPLLQEYFYNDYALIQAVLNSNRMIEKKEEKTGKLFAIDSLVNELDLENKPIYKVADLESDIWNDKETYIALYENKIARKINNLNKQDETDTESKA